MRILRNVIAGVVAVWLIFVGVIYYEMRQPPVHFAAFISHVPEPLFAAFPFETLWNRARGGALQVGSPAPDFRLKTLDRASEVSLSSFRGAKPVVLVFGSYT